MNFWQATEYRLRQMEADEEYDLFAIGYVIPQVVLAESKVGEDQSPKQCLIEYIESSMKSDAILEEDRKLIYSVLDEATRNAK